MTWHRTTDLDEFDAAAGALLRSKPVANTIALTLLENCASAARTRSARRIPSSVGGTTAP
jgi:hypothetical protein